MMDAWGAFARTGDPSTPSLRWPRYDEEGEQHLTLDIRSTVGAHLKRGVCEFWDSVDRTR
jgi:carboxylesterase type B